MHVPSFVSNPDQAQAYYFAAMACGLGLAWAIMRPSKRNVMNFVLAPLAYAAVAIVAAFNLAFDGFHFLTLLDWGLFGGGIIGCVMAGYYCGTKYKVLRVFFGLFAFLLAAIFIDAFLIEPHWLEVRQVTLHSDKLKKPLTIGILSDLQTDHVGEYERTVLTKLMDAHPDLILLPGDYIQQNAPARWDEQRALHDLLKDLKVSAPMGAYAVRGNVEDDGWESIFAGLPFHTFPKSDNVIARDDVRIYGLTLDDSFNDKLHVDAPKDKFSIVFGHGPDFALGDVQADLLVAGHTHGGQVQLPGFGPPITCSKMPAKWGGGGVFEVRPTVTMILTRGAGMERFLAPRMRFLCHPEIVIAHVVPTTASAQ